MEADKWKFSIVYTASVFFCANLNQINLFDFKPVVNDTNNVIKKNSLDFGIMNCVLFYNSLLNFLYF